VQNLKRKKIKPEFSKFNIFQQTAKDGRKGLDGIDGLRGLQGKAGDNGDNGISVTDAFQVDSNYFKLVFSNGEFSQQIKLPEPPPAKDGKAGKDAKGKDGKNAPTIVDIQAFARQVIFRFSDGSEIAVPLRFPSGSGTNAGLAFGGMEPPVKDVRGVDPIIVDDRNGIFFVSIKDASTTGLPWYNVPVDQAVEIPLNHQHLTLGDVTSLGDWKVIGAQVVL